MATSSKVRFDLRTLRNKALENIQTRLEEQEKIANEYGDPAFFDERVTEWRTKQIERVLAFASRLRETPDDISDQSIAAFRVEEMPTNSRWEYERAVEGIALLQAKKRQIEAKTSALVPDADGSISLTKTQLLEFFGI